MYGRVVESGEGQGLGQAEVSLFTYSWRGLSLAATTQTDPSGTYEMEVRGDHLYRAYAYYDLDSTPGFDYVPAHRDISVEGESLNVSFTLVPGATIDVGGEVPLPGYPWRASAQLYAFGERGALRDDEYVTESANPLDTVALNLPGGVIVLPSGLPVRVEATINFGQQTWDGAPAELSLSIGLEGDYLNLAQGELLTVNLRGRALRFYADNVLNSGLESVRALAGSLQNAGFYVSCEETRLSKVASLLNVAGPELNAGEFDSAQASFQEAYLLLKDVERSLNSMLTNAPQSVFLVTPLLSVTSLAVASIFCERRRTRVELSLALYSVLFGLLFLLYPGYTVILSENHQLWSVTLPGSLTLALLSVLSFLVPLLLAEWVPRAYRENPSREGLCLVSAISAAFSVAVRNMKRRRLRTFLTALFVAVAVLAFTVLTSLSSEYGFSVQSLARESPTEGLVARKPLVGQPRTFRPIESAIIEWLQERPDVALAVPKLENTPVVVYSSTPPYLCSLETPEPSATFDLSGMLGIYPSHEASVTQIDSIIVQGRFLGDDDINGVLISEEAAMKLHVTPSETITLLGHAYSLAGVFSAEKLSALNDVDGVPLVPQYVRMVVNPRGPPSYLPYYVPSVAVVILHAEAAKSLPAEVSVSRVSVKTRSSADISVLAREAVLVWPDLECFSSVAGRVEHLFIGPYAVGIGFFEATIPLVLVVLNVGVVMLSAVYERRREAAIMSCVGLNPTHIGVIFVAEALSLGFIAGSLGYLSGLISYRPIAFFSATLEVKPKVEALWGIYVVCFSILASVVSAAVPAAKASVIATSSLLRRWRISAEERPEIAGGAWPFLMPIQIRWQDLRAFFTYVEERLRAYSAYTTHTMIQDLKVSGEMAATRIRFTHLFTYGTGRTGSTENELYAVAGTRDRYGVRLSSKTATGYTERLDEACVRETATFIRQLVLKYSHDRSLAAEAPRDY